MKRTRKQRLFSILLVISMIMQQTFVLPAVAEDHVETETAAAVTQTAEAPETKAAKTEVQEQKAPETQAPVTEAPKPEVQETKETPAPATEAPKPEVQETQETPAPATEAPVTEAPQTEAPVTEAPQTEAPVTEAPQTEAPVTEAPQTEAPVTEAPETEAPVTEAPETEAPVTEAPETEAPATEAPETETEIKETETETESETESETETEAPKTHFTYEDGRVRITADASESAKLPQDAVLKADYLAPGSAAYNAAVAKVKAAYGLGDDVELECAPYDIYFVSKGNRIEPENGTVKVTIQFVKPVLGEAEGDLIDKGIAHIKDNGSVEDLNGSVNTNAQGAVSSVGFTTDSFSVFAPFTVSQVTAQAATSSNLNQFVTNVVFDNNLYDADGALVLHPNSEYSFKMEFAESIDKGLFEKEGVLTYTFPAQLTPAGAGGTFDMNITAGETQYTLSGNTYTIEGNTIKVSFNKDGGAAYEALKAASNAEFWLSLRAKVDANASGDKIKFGDSVEKTVKFDNTAAVSVEKSGSYDKTSGKMNYTVKVKSTGTSTNVKVTDVITGTLLTYDKNVTATSNQKGALTVDPNATAKGNGFEYTIPSMSDGEEVTFSYSASVDYSKLSGDKFTADETKNTVTAKGDNTDEVSKDHNFDHTMAYDTGITKSGTKGEITNGWQTSNWTITVNADAKTDVGGSLVTDKIQENKKVPTKYSGAGITVKKYKADGTLVSSEPIPWDQLKSHSDTTWSYELPQKDGTPYKYEISYTTTSDISKTTENTSVTNHAEFDGKGTDGSVGVEGQNQFGVTKTHAAPSKDGVNWTVDVTIPNCGFNESFTITDALPFTWTGGYHADSYKEGSLQIAMNGQTIAADNYDIKYTAPVTEGHNKSSGSIQVVFKPEKLAGLFPATTGTERVLTMTYTTIPDSTWPDGENHTNTVTATGDGTSKNASDSYILKEHEISKSVENGNATIGGMPAYKFKIYLRGVDTDTLEIHDIFDPDLFEIVTTDSNSYNNAQFGAGDESWIADNGANGSSNGGTLTVTPTETGATFSIKNVATKSGGAYYSWYSIRYYLKVKDAEALKKIQQEAAKNPDHTTKIGNTAEWEGKSTGEVSVDYKVNPLTKTETGSPNKLNHYTSTFTVVVNPDKLQLNGGNDLTVTDTFSDAMELVTDSVQITLEPEGTSSWDFDTDKKGLTVTIPDECKATITYQAQIIGTGTVTYKNNVTVTGNYTASTGDKTAQITTDGEGSAEHFQYKVIKRDAHDKQKRLQGAIFQLFELTDGSETAVKNNKTGGDVTFTTDANGEFMMAGAYQADGWELTKGHTYVLKEIQAPEGYKKADPLTFTVGSITADGAHGNGYTFDIYDEEGKDIDISVVKTWNDADNQDGKRPESVMVQLYANGHPQSDPVELNAGNNWSYKWEKLPDKENGELIAYTVRELQRNEDGSMTPVDDRAKITYLVNNENVTYEVGYSNTDNAWTISNTHTPETINIEGSKTWDDANNQDGKRPSSITIRLYADGTELTDKVQTVTAANNWSWKFTDLPKYKDAGTEIEYTITEDAVENYMTVVDGYNVTNMHIPATINISGGKHWDDANNQDGKRPSSITIRLYADGTALTDKVQTVTAADNWKWTFTNLPKYANGREIVYTISEDAVTNYTTSVSGYNVTNTYTPEVVRVVIRKVWDDENNQDGKRPTELKVDLKKKVGNSWNAPNELVQTITLNEGNGWQMEIENLPKYTNGKLNLYNWSEHTAGLEEKGYYFKSIVTEGEITTLTNTHVPEKVEASVRKVWDDNNNQDGKRPTDIIVKLYGKAGEAAEEEILKTTLNEANNWTFTKTNLPKFKDGVAYTYYWTEETQLPDYTVEAAQENSGNSFVTTLTNTHTPEKTPATVKKVWDDANNNDGKRPETITVVLKKKNGQTETIVGSHELNEDNGWTATETELDVYTNGVANEYIWEESSLPKGYSLESRDVNGTVTTLTNKYAPGKVSASVEKEWNDADNQDGIRPTSLEVVLKKNGEVYKTVTLNSENHWSYTVSDLEEYTDGVKNIYTWEEVSVPEGYTLSSSTQESTTTLTNTHIPETVNATVYKVWDDNNNQDGIRPLELTVTLWRRAKQLETDIPSAGAAVEVKTVTLNQANNWSAEETGLAKYTTGVENEYFWTEGSITGYMLKNGSTMNSDNAYITTLTNEHTPEKTSATVEKRWRDNDNQDGKRPESITVILKKSVNGLVGTVDTYTLTAGEDGSWKKTVDDLPKYENGTEIQYFWEESQEGLNGYQPLPSETGDNMTLLVNAYTPEETSVSVQKVWNDDGNRDGIRPESITVTLYAEADGVAKHKVDEAVLDETNLWTATKSGLAKNVNGKPYTYTWEEENVPEGYTLTTGYDSEDTSKTILTNTHIPEKVEASVEKVWNDNNNQDGKRPTGITVKLYGKAGEAAAEEILETTLNEANNWKYTKTDLLKFKNGVAYTYYWTEETQLPGYTVEAAQQNGEKSFVTTLTNTHTPEKASATVEKRWRDNDNQDRKRPESITVILKKSVNGLVGTVDTYTLTAGEDGSWKKTVDDLPKYENGTEIQYFWEESQEGLNGYQPLPSETGDNMTLLVNAYTPEETSVSVQKVWNDDGNRDGIRPESITVTLYAEADGVAKHKVDEAVLNEINHWAATKSGLAKNVNGKPYTYTWEEENVPEGYTLTTGYDSEDTSKTILTNTHTPETVNATVVKVWDDADNQDGKRPQDLTVTLMKNETVVVQTVTLDAANNWTAEVENLAKNENGTPIRYSWVEGTMPEGYSLESAAVTDEKNSDDVVIGTITTLTNTYAPGKVSASVKKVWDDTNNQDGIRPETLRVNLLKNGQATDQFVILSEENRWSATLDNLDEYTDGTLNEYTWSEELPNGYTVTVSDPDEVGTTTLTNTHTPATIGASVEKIWDDNDNQDGKRPEKLLVTLMRRIREQAVPISLDDADDADTNPAEEVKTVELTAAHNWKASVSNLPKYKDGQMYEYFWTEKEDNIPNGYKLTNEVTYNILSPGEGVTGFITRLTNSHKPQKINAIVKKVWDDNENQDGKRASELTVELMRNGTEVAGTVTLNEENNWTDTVENLDKYTGGVENGYTWVEKNLPEGYSLTDTKKEVTEATENTLEAAITTLTNSYTPGKVEASVLKVWNDGENQDGIRPSEITVTLVKNNEPTTQSVTLSEVNHWTAAITGLDEYTNGTLNEYTWKEAEVPDGYTLTNTKKEGRLTTLTNTHTPEVVNATIRKTWNDSDNQDGVRPTEIKVDLKKNDQVIQTVTLDTANGWETTVEDLPKYTAGVENIYTWAEQEDGLPEGYELTGDVTVGEVTTLTNTRVPDTVSVGVRKIWNDAENQDGIRPSELRVDLLKNGELTGQYVILNEENGWTAMITNLPKNTAVAEPNVYTWSEELPDGYTVTVSDPDEMGITTLTNTHTPDTIEASVEKTWDDNDDQDGKRPEKLFVTLMRRIREQAVPISLDDVGTNPAEEVKTVELTAANDWKASVSDLPKYSDGQMYEYFWTEKEDNIPDGYELTNEVTYDILSPGKGVTGFITTLTNTHTPQKINAVVKKVWDDKDNQDGKRPTELTVDLMRNGTEVAGTVTLNEENGWTDTVENLDKYTGGVENVYTWAEKNLPEGYSLTDTKKEVTEATEDTLEAAITTLTNKHTPGKVSASILKIWDDAKNQDGKRPETITAILVKNGEETDQKVTLSADNEWSAIIKDLDEYTNGTLNKYTWKEAEVPEGYELTLNKTDGTFTTLTNTHVPELVNVSVRKEWDDADNQDGIRPAELKVDLKKNGEVIATVTLNEENSWSDGVKDLPKYTAGVENIYTWAEQEDGLPEGYELTDTKTEELLAPPMEGEEVLPTETVSIITTLTNTHTPETVNIEGAKTWADSGNESARPESITIRIYADGEELTDLAKTVTADDDWKWSFTDLPKYKEGEVGQEITYTITEDPVDGYISEVDGYDVTNTRSAAVSKVDIGTGEELTGAHFQVLDGAGNIVDEWDSESGTNHVIKGIETDVEYTLHESKAPEGYEVTADVTFTVAKDGTVTATASVVNGVIIVEDKLKPSENTSTTIEKKITYNGLELFAENLSFYVRLFYDKECTKPATELKEIKIVNAMSGKVTFDNLEAGRTYYAGECDADGNVMYSGVLEDGTVYTPVFTGTNGQVVTVEEGENKVVYLDNQLQSWPHNFYAKGTLTVTKKLLGADGEAKDSDEVFYAGIFDDPEYTTLSERVEYNLLELDMSGGSETSMSTNVQIESLDSVTTLYVTEVDEDGNPVKGAPGFAYEVSADKTEVNIDPKHTKAEVTITNKEKSYEGRLTVTKKLVTEDGRAKDSDETFYAGIFDDADFTQLSDKVEENILTLALNGASEVTAQTKVKVDSADSVTTLYVTEVDVDGNPVKEMAGFKYGVSVDKEEVEIAAGREASVIITNVELPHNPYQHGELTVTKKLLGADGKPKNSNGVFYAGIFDDPEYTTLSDKVEYNVLELDLNGNAEASAMTKVDIAKKDSTVTLYVTEVDEEGNPIAGAAGFKYEVSVDQTKVDLTAERSKAVVVITNKEVPETESETQPTTKPTKGVKTGDDTPIGGYAGLMAIAFAAFALLVVSEQKRRKSGRE